MLLRKAIPWAVGLCLLVTGALGFIGCDDGGGELNELPTNWVSANTGVFVGEWKHVYNTDSNLYSQVTVSSNAVFHYGDPSYPDYDYDGGIEAHTDYDAKFGVIIFKTTKASNSGKEGKYTAAYWWGRAPNYQNQESASISTVYRDLSAEFFDTLDDAKANFTLAKAGDWVGTWGGPYLKQ